MRVLDWLLELIDRGGPVMYPLLAVSVLSLALIVERSWFWLYLRRRATLVRLGQINQAFRRNDRQHLARLINRRSTPFDHIASQLFQNGPDDSTALDAVQLHRPRFERFMITMSTIITVAPLLGILGTVTGIIQSFQLMGEAAGMTDPRVIAPGIAQALLTTAVGLVIAIYTVLPYMVFRGQVEQALGQVESMIAAAQQGWGKGQGKDSDSQLLAGSMIERVEDHQTPRASSRSSVAAEL